MIKTYGDRQPGLGTSAIVGALTLAKTGTTARTATFPDAAITVAGINLAQTWTATQTFGTNTAQTDIISNGAAGQVRTLTYQTAGVNRWKAYVGVTAETGSDAGTEWSLAAYTDAGAFIGNVITASRAAGTAITLARPVTCTGTVTVPNGTAAAPGIRLTSEASGLYRIGATSIGVSVAGALVLTVGSTASSFASGTTVSIANTTASSSTITGALTVSGGAGFGGAGYFGGNIVTSATAIASSMALDPGRSAVVTNNSSCWFYRTDGSGSGDFASAGHFIIQPRTTTGSARDVIIYTGDTTPTERLRVSSTGVVSVTNTSITSIQTSGGMTFAAIAAATTAGGLQRESNQDTHYAYTNAIGGWLDKCIFSQYASVTQSGIVTAQSLASATARGTRTLPANFFKAGKVLRFRLCGRYTTDAAAGNATVSILLGSTTFRTTGSFVLDNSSTNLPWEIEGEITCQTTGATGTVEGVVWWAHGITGATGNFNIESMAGTGAVTVDTTASAAFDVQWTATDAGTSITCTCFRLWEVC